MQEYRNISNKLKKKFLKKPNVFEGSEQFGRLAKQLKVDGCPHYSGFCYLAQARCEHTLGNWCSEASTLIEAARSFVQAERSIQETLCPSFQEHLNAAINCYSHAIRIYLENKQYSLAASLCIELGNALKMFGKTSQSIQHFQRATELLQHHPMECLDALNFLAAAKIETKDYEGALVIYTEMFYLAKERGPTSCAQKTIGAVADILAQCEIFRLLLLLLLQPAPQRTRPEHSQLLEKYLWNASDEDLSKSVLGEELFLLVQSVVMACHAKNISSLKQLESLITPHLTSLQVHLLHLVLETINNEGQQYGHTME